MEAVFIDSERLHLRPFTLADAPFILELLNSKGWLEFIGNSGVQTLQQAEQYLLRGPIRSCSKIGLGLSLVALKSNAQPVGMCGFVKRDYLDHLDIGFAYLPDHTGKGYAYEMAVQTLEYGFGKMGAEKLLAITAPDNRASIGLLKKLGMTFEEVIDRKAQTELLLYGVDRKVPLPR